MKRLCAAAAIATLCAAPTYAAEADIFAASIGSAELMAATSQTYSKGDLWVKLNAPFVLPAGVFCAGNYNLFAVKASDDQGGKLRSLLQTAMRERKTIALRIIEEASSPCSIIAAGIYK